MRKQLQRIQELGLHIHLFSVHTKNVGFEAIFLLKRADSCTFQIEKWTTKQLFPGLVQHLWCIWIENHLFCLFSPAKEKSSMRPTATCEHFSSSRYIQDLSFSSWKLLLTMERRGRLQITSAGKHWNCFPHSGTVPYTVTLSSSNSKSGQVPFGRGCFNHIQNLSVERTKRTDRATWCHRQGDPFWV